MLNDKINIEMGHSPSFNSNTHDFGCSRLSSGVGEGRENGEKEVVEPSLLTSLITCSDSAR